MRIAGVIRREKKPGRSADEEVFLWILGNMIKVGFEVWRGFGMRRWVEWILMRAEEEKRLAR